MLAATLLQLHDLHAACKLFLQMLLGWQPRDHSHPDGLPAKQRSMVQEAEQLASDLQRLGSSGRVVMPDDLRSLELVSLWLFHDRAKAAGGEARRLAQLDAFFQAMADAMRGISLPAAALSDVAGGAMADLDAAIKAMLKGGAVL